MISHGQIRRADFAAGRRTDIASQGAIRAGQPQAIQCQPGLAAPGTAVSVSAPRSGYVLLYSTREDAYSAVFVPLIFTRCSEYSAQCRIPALRLALGSAITRGLPTNTRRFIAEQTNRSCEMERYVSIHVNFPVFVLEVMEYTWVPMILHKTCLLCLSCSQLYCVITSLFTFAFVL